MIVVLVILVVAAASGFIGALLFHRFSSRKKSSGKIVVDDSEIPPPQMTDKDYFNLLDTRLRESGLYLKNDCFRGDMEKMIGIGRNRIASVIRAGGFDNIPAYVCSLRMEAALKLMESAPEKTLSVIAIETGFDSVQSFSRSFKEKFGDTPLHYRKTHFAY